MAEGHELTWQASTAARILEAGKKNGRIGNRKSRGGCLTCKARRVKCDERRPECDKCLSSGRRCQGYADRPPQSSTRKKTSLIGLQLSQSLGLDERDARTFDYFLSWTAPRLSGPLDRDFWCGYVLQFAQSEPLVLDSLLAISILYEHPQYLKSFRASSADSQPGSEVSPSFEDNQEPSNPAFGLQLVEDSPEPVPSGILIHEEKLDKHHATALKHYNHAINAVMKKIESGKENPHLALLSCVLFMCIEFIRDNVFAALKLFIQGYENQARGCLYDLEHPLTFDSTKLLRELGDYATGPGRELFIKLKLIFARIAVLASEFGHPEPLDVSQDLVALRQDGVFATLYDARTSLYILMADIHAHARDVKSFRKPSEMEDDPIYSSQTSNQQSTAEDGSQPSPYSSDSGKTAYSTQMSPHDASSRFDQISQRETPPERNKHQPYTGVTRLYYGCDNAMEKDKHVKRTETFPKVDAFALPQALLERQAELQARLGQWYDTFRRTGRNDQENAICLLIQYHVICIWLFSRLSPFETVYDQYTSIFEEIIRLAEAYVGYKSEPPTFTFEVGIVSPLYFVAMKCRVPSLRRKAVDLIRKSPGKECIWGSKSVAELATRLVSIEEEDLSQQSTPASFGKANALRDPETILPTESSRITSIQLLRHKQTNRHDVRVTRYSYDLEGHRVRTIVDYPI